MFLIKYFFLIFCFIFSGVVIADSDSVQATKSIEWIKSFNCPMPGRPLNIPHLESTQKAREMAISNWAFAISTQQSITQSLNKKKHFIETIGRKRALTSDDREALNALDEAALAASAKIATSLVQWSLAKFVELSMISSTYFPDSRTKHPLYDFINEEEKLLQFTKQLKNTVITKDFFSPIHEKFSQCLFIAQQHILQENSASIVAASDNVHSSSEIDQILYKYNIVAKPVGLVNQRQPSVIAKLINKKNELIYLETLAANEKERVLNIEKERTAALRRKQEEKYLREKISQAKKNLPTAKRFVKLLTSHSPDQAADLMSNDITLHVPQLGTRRGKSAVMKLMSQSSGHLSAPSINNQGEISSKGNAQGRPIQLYITILGSLVTQLRVVT